MYFLIYYCSFSWITWVLLLILSFVIGLVVYTENYFIAEFDKDDVEDEDTDDDLQELNGPIPLPVIGSLHLLSGYKVIYEAFVHLSFKYGEVFKIKLGSIPCVIVNGVDNIREVLMAKGDHFDGRPNFQRYNLLFNGDKRNSLAFCDWSELQKTRRELLRIHAVPRSFSLKFHELNAHIYAETNTMFERIAFADGQPLALKPLLLHTCANIFLQHFSGKRYDYRDPSFCKMIYYFDKIFYEVNQGCAGDFMPWMLPLFYRRHFNEIRTWPHYIQDFVTQMVNERYVQWSPDKDNADFVDTLVEMMHREHDTEINLEIAVHSLGDIIGGHSAVGNFLMKMFAYIATRPHVQVKIKKEIQTITKVDRHITLFDKKQMPYTESVILETMRLIASPIVPHVASQDSSIAGYKVKKGTLIFLNNYGLNRSTELWKEPERFDPERFLNEGVLFKPEHFFPFSTGRRSCMGYKLVQLLSFSILALTLQKYTVLPVEGCSYEVPIGDLALPFDTFKFKFV